ncbi:keratin-associated 5-1-like isoform X19 [Pelobates cultripes]|uniref:Keratin-associated 5-1-like isoform X19 n=1 Tax=Pelobates cultripes TaxID=61616 RepID=A0AAD1TLF6_PELCU|nr:keratin-associated 5-1-like isoform X19 [Pelobates cultripes]
MSVILRGVVGSSGTPGFCPAAKPNLSPCFIPCTKCPNGQKCCPWNCRDECVTTLPEKPGSCPKDDIVCKQASHQMCTSDDNCPNDKKCCSYKCGRACVSPVSDSEKPGVCPPERFVISKGDKAKWCHSDKDCLDDKKCCPQSEGTVCKTPAEERSEQCPRRKRIGLRCDDECTSDSECAPDLKCCMSRCGLSCVTPLGGTPGYCPDAKPDLSPCFFPCIECPEGQKCCPKNCRDECVTPLFGNIKNEKPGVCPPERFVIKKGDRAKWCDSDQDCLDDKKCCPHSEGSVCKTPAKERRGQCPWGELIKPRCDDECTSDSECAPDFKCCMSGCGFKCVPPLGVTPGFCPAAKPNLSPCFVPCKKCPKGQKCCPRNCRDECVPTLPETLQIQPQNLGHTSIKDRVITARHQGRTPHNPQNTVGVIVSRAALGVQAPCANQSCGTPPRHLCLTPCRQFQAHSQSVACTPFNKTLPPFISTLPPLISSPLSPFITSPLPPLSLAPSSPALCPPLSLAPPSSPLPLYHLSPLPHFITSPLPLITSPLPLQ